MARPLKKFVLDHTKCWVNIGIKSCEKEVMLKKSGKNIFGFKQFLCHKNLVTETISQKN